MQRNGRATSKVILLLTAACWVINPFSSTPEGQFVLETLYQFEPFPKHPVGRLFKASDGSFYGTSREGGAHNAGTVYKMTPDGEVAVVASLDRLGGGQPIAGVTERDGFFYGVRPGGSYSNSGYVFKVSPGGEITRVIEFNWNNGRMPMTELMLSRDGNLYGTTSAGLGAGTLFKISPVDEFQVLFRFDPGIFYDPRGNHPNALIRGSDGHFYGSTAGSPESRNSFIYRMNPAGVLTILYQFGGRGAGAPEEKGRIPKGSLVEGRDGRFYGATQVGGISDAGTVFLIDHDLTFHSVAHFDGANGRAPLGGLVEGGDGNFYGTTSKGGVADMGTVFQVTPSGELTSLVSFDGANGAEPPSGLVEGDDGALYGTTMNGGSANYGTVFRMTLEGELTTLHSFHGDGAPARGGLVEHSDGDIYGVTGSGGKSGMGTVFKLSSGGRFASLVDFDGDNGWSPVSLTLGNDGNFYGATYLGGAHDRGTIFRVTAAGHLTTLVHFAGANGSFPLGRLTPARKGGFWGTTTGGGASDRGTVFWMDADGALTTLVALSGSDGSSPQSELVEASDGALYGAARYGGSANAGTVFRVDPTDAGLTVLAQFQGANGAYPGAELVEDAQGFLYGTTELGGAFGGAFGYGTIFKANSGGGVTTLVHFDHINYLKPSRWLMIAADSYLYGVTPTGGAHGSGSVFRLSPSGELTTIYHFDPQYIHSPNSRLMEGADGSFYGVAERSGASTLGAIYRLRPVEQWSIRGTSIIDGELRAEVMGSPGAGFVVEDSIDLVDWAPVSTNTLPNSPLEFTLPFEPSDAKRFYRVRAP